MARRRGKLVTCDIDLTLLAGDQQPHYKAQADKALEVLTDSVIMQRLLDPNELLYFGTNSGRTLRSQHEEVEENNPAFKRAMSVMDILIGSVGAEMALRKGNSFVPVEVWPGTVLGWDREKASHLLQTIQGIGTLTLQGEMAQSNNKLSFTVETARKPHLGYADTIRTVLARAGVESTVTFSNGMYLDILPRLADGTAIDKGVSAIFGTKVLAERDNLNEEPQLIFIGDSKNDEPGFSCAIASGGLGIIPGNAKQAFKLRMQDTYPESQLYVAQRTFAAGGQEGLHHFGVLS